MQRCDWTLTACQEERAAVLRPKTQTQPGPGRQWNTSEEGIYTVLNARASEGHRPGLSAAAVEAAAVLFLPSDCVSLRAGHSNPYPLLLMRLKLLCGDAATNLSEI